jgi:hypothetical protein
MDGWMDGEPIKLRRFKEATNRIMDLEPKVYFFPDVFCRTKVQYFIEIIPTSGVLFWERFFVNPCVNSLPPAHEIFSPRPFGRPPDAQNSNIGMEESKVV